MTIGQPREAHAKGPGTGAPEARRDASGAPDGNDGAPTAAQRRVVSLCLLAGLVMALSFVEIPAFVPWLKYDPSGAVSLLATIAFGPVSAVAITVVGWLPHLFFDPFGTLIAIVTMACAIAALAGARRLLPGRPGTLVGLGVASVVFVAVALLLNVLITPLYNAMTVQGVLALVVPVLLPFNLVKVGLCDAITLALLVARRRLATRTSDGR